MFKTVNNKIMLTDLPYQIGKNLVLIYIPAISSAYFGLSSIWGLPAAGQVSGTLAIVATFLGTCLRVSAKNYDNSGAAHDGKIVVSENPNTGNMVYNVEPDLDPKEWSKQKAVSLKIVHQKPSKSSPKPPHLPAR